MTRPIPAYVMPPGEHLADELEARDLTQKEFAQILGRPPQAISEIITAKKSITPEMALLLSEALGTSPEFWTNLQTQYDLWKARQNRTPDPAVPLNMRLRELAPVAELQKRGWLPVTTDPQELSRAVCLLLDIQNVQDMPQMAANFRQGQSTAWTPERAAQLAWLKYVEKQAIQQQVAKYSPDRLDVALADLLRLTTEPQAIGAMPRLLAQAGVRFVLAEHLPKSYVNGAAFWTDGVPVVALSERYPSMDRMWFNLLHELGHIRRGHEGVQMDDFDGKQDRVSQHEQEADLFARDLLIPSLDWQDFIFAGKTTPEAVVAFARQIGRHPSIVAGRLRFERGWWNRFKALDASVQPHLPELRAAASHR